MPGPAVPQRATSGVGWSTVTRYLDSMVAEGAAPGAVLGVSYRGRRFYHGAGRLGLDDATRPDSATVYDLASLTKVVGLTSMLMLAVQEGRISLDTAVSAYVPAFRGSGTERVTIRHLLTHSSGLPGWRPLYKEAGSRTEAFALVDRTPLDTEPGTRMVYSDLGAILLTQVLERVYGTRLDSLLASRIFRPLGLRHTCYQPLSGWRSRIAPTENDPWRGRTLRGEVHDENAARMDSVSGHAGLFSTAEDLLTFAEWMLQRRAEDCTPARSGVACEFTRRQNLPPGSSRALGWDTPSEGSSAGTRLGPDSFGHTGFTGTSLWIDPSGDLAIVLLSNRVHPTRENQRWAPVRARVADLVVTTIRPDVQ